MLDANGIIYEIVHYPSVGASTVALSIGLDYIIKNFLDEDLPEFLPGTGVHNLIEVIVEKLVDPWSEITFIDLKGKIDMEKVENMLRSVFKWILRTRFPIGCLPSTMERPLVSHHLKTVLSDELESNNIGLDADQILDQLNLVTFENSKSISESLILYLRKTIYHLTSRLESRLLMI